jgi:hypothetical protein
MVKMSVLALPCKAKMSSVCSLAAAAALAFLYFTTI